MCNQPSKSGKFLDESTWDALKAAGFTEQELQADQPFGPVIFSYTRKQAIEDGVLMDITPLARGAGFTIHTAMTCGVNEALLDIVRRHEPQDLEKYPLERIRTAAIRAMLHQLHDEIGCQKGPADRLNFTCGDAKLWAHVGPGDEGEPVLTIMLQGED